MYELERAGECSYYINCPAKIGVFVSEGGAYLIDGGSDKDAGKRAKRILDEKGWALRGILVTHSHADHIGGCAYLQQQTGCKVFANGAEAAFTQYPLFEPSLLYGGCPPKELRHKFLMAQGCNVSSFSDSNFPQQVEPIPLYGHFFEMTGFRTPDGTVFLADCLSSRETLEKYRISYIYDVKQYLETLERVKAMKAPLFVPSHAQAAEDITALAQFNIDTVKALAEDIVELCKQPQQAENLLAAIFERYALKMTFEQYALVGSTLRSYLTWLHGEGRVDAVFEDNRLFWRSV